MAKFVPEESLQRLAGAARSRGLTLLSKEWHGSTGQHEFRCGRGHVLLRRADYVIADSQRQDGRGKTRCPLCARIDGLDRLIELADRHGGRCLATEYLGMNTPYEWECARGHRWSVQAENISQGSWCAKCWAKSNGLRKRLVDGMERLREKAAALGGECLDTSYIGLKKKYRVRCGRGHEWETKGAHLLEGRWCKRCVVDQLRTPIEVFKNAARERGGLCLSTESHGVKVRLQWQCAKGHIWETSPESILTNGSWCPSCALLERTKIPWKRRRYDVDG